MNFDVTHRRQELVTPYRKSSGVIEPVQMFGDNFNTENGGVAVGNYTGFANWDLVDTEEGDSKVDLIDVNTIPEAPDQGLFVDLLGTSSPYICHFRSKTAFQFQAGFSYRLVFKLAGNLRNSGSSSELRVTIGDMVSESYVPEWDQLFTVTTINFQCSESASEKISFVNELLDGAFDVGNMIDDVYLYYLLEGTVEAFTARFDLPVDKLKNAERIRP